MLPRFGVVDAEQAMQFARDVYTRRMEGCSIWVVRSDQIHATQESESESMFDPAEDKVYRHPTFYEFPDGVNI